jgi:hypothetical protein
MILQEEQSLGDTEVTHHFTTMGNMSVDNSHIGKHCSITEITNKRTYILKQRRRK